MVIVVGSLVCELVGFKEGVEGWLLGGGLEGTARGRQECKKQEVYLIPRSISVSKPETCCIVKKEFWMDVG